MQIAYSYYYDTLWEDLGAGTGGVSVLPKLNEVKAMLSICRQYVQSSRLLRMILPAGVTQGLQVMENKIEESRQLFISMNLKPMDDRFKARS
jgi:hypothetical protein